MNWPKIMGFTGVAAAVRSASIAPSSRIPVQAWSFDAAAAPISDVAELPRNVRRVIPSGFSLAGVMAISAVEGSDHGRLMLCIVESCSGGGKAEHRVRWAARRAPIILCEGANRGGFTREPATWPARATPGRDSHTMSPGAVISTRDWL